MQRRGALRIARPRGMWVGGRVRAAVLGRMPWAVADVERFLFRAWSVSVRIPFSERGVTVPKDGAPWVSVEGRRCGPGVGIEVGDPACGAARGQCREQCSFAARCLERLLRGQTAP